MLRSVELTGNKKTLLSRYSASVHTSDHQEVFAHSQPEKCLLARVDRQSTHIVANAWRTIPWRTRAPTFVVIVVNEQRIQPEPHRRHPFGREAMLLEQAQQCAHGEIRQVNGKSAIPLVKPQPSAKRRVRYCGTKGASIGDFQTQKAIGGEFCLDVLERVGWIGKMLENVAQENHVKTLVANVVQCIDNGQTSLPTGGDRRTSNIVADRVPARREGFIEEHPVAAAKVEQARVRGGYETPQLEELVHRFLRRLFAVSDSIVSKWMCGVKRVQQGLVGPRIDKNEIALATAHQS